MNQIEFLDLQQKIGFYITEYTVHAFRNTKIFEISNQEKLLNHKKITFKSKVKHNNEFYHPDMLIIIDQYLNWNLFGFVISEKQMNKKIKCIISSKEINLFAGFSELNEISNKQRKVMKCFINYLSLQKKYIIEFQISILPYLFILEIMDRNELVFSSKIINMCENLTYTFTNKDKVVAFSKNFNIKPNFEEYPLIKSQDYFIKAIVYDQNIQKLKNQQAYSIYIYYVDKRQYKMMFGEVIFSNFNTKPKQIYISTDSIFIFLPEKIIYYDIRTRKIVEFAISSQSITQISSQKFRFIDKGNYLEIKMQNSQFSTKTILTNFQKYHSIYESEHKNVYYGINMQNSLYTIEIKNSSVIQNLILSHDTFKIYHVVNIKDTYSNVLAITKKRENDKKQQYYSNQSHQKQISHYIHNFDFRSTEICHIKKNIIMITSQNLGTFFLKINLDSDKIILQNVNEYNQFEKKEKTLLFKTIKDSDIQITLSRIITKNLQNPKKTTQIKSLFDNLDIKIDFCVSFNELFLFTVKNQVHIYSLKNNNFQFKFIYCLDQQIEFIKAANQYNSLIIKFFESNNLEVYYVSVQKQQLIKNTTLKEENQLLIIRSMQFAIQFNTINYILTLIIRKNNPPLVLLTKNQFNYREKQKIDISKFQIKWLSSYYYEILIEVLINFQSDKYILLAGDLLIFISKSYVGQNLLQEIDFMVMKNFTSNQINQNIIFASLFQKNIIFKMGEKHMQVCQYEQSKFNISIQLINIDGYELKINCHKKGKESKLILMAYNIKQNKEINQQNFNKARQIKVFESSIDIPDIIQEFPIEIGIFDVEFGISKIKYLKHGLFLLYNDEEIWLIKMHTIKNKFFLAIYSKFSFENQQFNLFKNKFPNQELEQEIMQEFNKRYKFKQIETLKIQKSFSKNKNQLIVLYEKFLLILQIDCLVFKISQIIKFDYQIQSILDNYQNQYAYVKGNNNLLFKLYKNSNKYIIDKVEELQENIVFATNIENWNQKHRNFKLNSKDPAIQSVSRLIVKEFGQLQTLTNDGKDKSIKKQVYI